MDKYNDILDSWYMVELINEGDLFDSDAAPEEMSEAIISDPQLFFKEKINCNVESDSKKDWHLELYFGVFRFDDLINTLRKTHGIDKTDEDINYGKKKFTLLLYFDSKLNLIKDKCFYTQCGYIRAKKQFTLEYFNNDNNEILQTYINRFSNDFNNTFRDIVEKYGDEIYYNVSDKERMLFHSFFIKDIELAKKYPTDNLKMYLGQISKEHDRVNLDDEKDLDNISNLLKPDCFPSGRFPSPPQFALSLMQQVAVNIAVNESDQTLKSVNGPPGTGKTTLLKDIFAEFAVEQAYRICNLRNKVLEKTLTYYKNGKIGVLPQSISDKGIVVASSNNGAVKNIVNEIPIIPRDKKTNQVMDSDDFYSELYNVNYFCKIARMMQDDLIIQNAKGKTKEQIDQIIKDTPDLYWGMYSAEGGNSGNLNKLDMYIDSIIKSLDDETENTTAYDEFEKLYKEVAVCKEKMSCLVKIQNQITENQKSYEECEKEIDNKEKELRDPNTPKGFLGRNLKRIKKEIQFDLERSNRFLRKIKEAKEGFDKEKTSLGDMGSNTMCLDKHLSHEELQQTIIFFGNEFRKKQSLLFIKSLAVRKQFLVANKESFKTAIKRIWNYRNSLDKTPEQLKAAWDWVNFAIPVISTTFASFGKMFSFMKDENIANLFIDEAGQATPLQAVGAVMRSRRIMAVGDPDQIEPVLTLDSNILSLIRKNYDISERFLSAESSVQTLVDHCSKYGYYKKDNDGDKWIGIPLWVHRRCKNPMFSISNKISYADKMVLAKECRGSIGKAKWIDVKGVAIDKYVAEQGNWLKQELEKKGIDKDKVYVISPFRNVVTQIKKLKVLKDSNVGTVHTFQGKETSIVYLVLGADYKSKSSASWAVSKPNIINVAATRAKDEFYIIGDKQLYKELGSRTIEQTFEVLDSFED